MYVIHPFLIRQSINFISLLININPVNLSSIMFGIIGSGSWATALTKILTDKK
jgi:hypothetical protein